MVLRARYAISGTDIACTAQSGSSRCTGGGRLYRAGSFLPIILRNIWYWECYYHMILRNIWHCKSCCPTPYPAHRAGEGGREGGGSEGGEGGSLSPYATSGTDTAYHTRQCP
eukprot:3636053-Rhodomonas_salina.1